MFPTKTRFLIVDDSFFSRNMVQKAISSLGFESFIEADSVAHAKEALNQRLSIGQPIQCVILDINMPEVSGLKLLEWARASEAFKNLPMIILTSNRSPEDVREATRLGASGYCTKPFDLSTFKKNLEAAWALHGEPFFKSLPQPKAG